MLVIMNKFLHAWLAIDERVYNSTYVYCMYCVSAVFVYTTNWGYSWLLGSTQCQKNNNPYKADPHTVIWIKQWPQIPTMKTFCRICCFVGRFFSEFVVKWDDILQSILCNCNCNCCLLFSGMIFFWICCVVGWQFADYFV